jgi:ubiquinone/menaquinone biosynthesis C-methylase UbiE
LGDKLVPLAQVRHVQRQNRKEVEKMPLENVQHHFSRLAPKYRGLRITDLEPILSIKTRLEGFPSRIMAADVGCGDGRYDLELFRHLGERLFLYCVDSNSEMLNEVDGYLSRHGIRDFNIKQSVATQLPFEDASLNCLFTFNAIHHFTLPRFLKEAKRVLKDGGHLFIYTRLRSQNRRSIWGRYFPLFHDMETRLYESWELEDILRTAKNLELEETEYFRYEREAALDRLIERARNHHYSTFSLYSRSEFERCCEEFEKNLRGRFSDLKNIRWSDQNVLLVIRKGAKGPGLRHPDPLC